jgi:hypothetical protein
MKVRNGFVSNSSSSSFCIYGVTLDFSDLIEKVKELKIITDEQSEKFDENNEWYELENILNEKTTLDIYIDNENDSAWIGRSWSSIKDNETGLQFKEEVESELEKVFGTGLDCDTYDEVIYD